MAAEKPRVAGQRSGTCSAPAGRWATAAPDPGSRRRRECPRRSHGLRWRLRGRRGARRRRRRRRRRRGSRLCERAGTAGFHQAEDAAVEGVACRCVDGVVRRIGRRRRGGTESAPTPTPRPALPPAAVRRLATGAPSGPASDMAGWPMTTIGVDPGGAIRGEDDADVHRVVAVFHQMGGGVAACLAGGDGAGEIPVDADVGGDGQDVEGVVGALALEAGLRHQRHAAAVVERLHHKHDGIEGCGGDPAGRGPAGARQTRPRLASGSARAGGSPAAAALPRRRRHRAPLTWPRSRCGEAGAASPPPGCGTPAALRRSAMKPRDPPRQDEDQAPPPRCRASARRRPTRRRGCAGR